MKLKVIGWVHYDDCHFEEGDNSLAAREAILDDIRANGYEFTGWHHQEYDCCAPVLNDGKVRTYSQRGWGGVMAEAHGMTGPMDYAYYAFHYDDEDIKTPSADRDMIHTVYALAAELLSEMDYDALFMDDFTLRCPHPELGDREIYLLTEEESEGLSPFGAPVRQVPNVLYRALVEENLQETYTLSRESCTVGEDYITVKYTETLRFMGRGDTVVIDGNTFTVKNVEPFRDVSEDVRNTVLFGSLTEGYDEAVKVFTSADVLLKITLE